jgi:hypothetical protein
MGAIARVAAAVMAGAVVLPAVVHGGHHHHRHGMHAHLLSDGKPVQVHASGNARLAMHMAAAHGWDGRQQGCLWNLWQRESAGTWSPRVTNPYCGALGIAQALGHGPTNQYPAGPANGPVYSARAQIAWGIGYIDHTYGTPCVAWSDWQARSPHWY